MAIGFVDLAVGSSSTSSVTTGAFLSAGSYDTSYLLVAAIESDHASSTISGWTQVGSTYTWGSTKSVCMFANFGSGGSSTVTATSTSSTEMRIYVWVLSGAKVTGTVTAAFTGQSGASSGGNVHTQAISTVALNSDNFIMGAVGLNGTAGGTPSVDSGATLDNGTSGSILLTAHRVAAVLGTAWTFTWTTNRTHAWVVGAALAAAAPTVTVSAPDTLNATTAVGNGNVTDDGGQAITERGFVWNTGGTPTTADSKVTASGTTGAYSATMTGLTANTAYYYRAYAINSIGTSYSAGAGTQFTSGESINVSDSSTVTDTFTPNVPDYTNTKSISDTTTVTEYIEPNVEDYTCTVVVTENVTVVDSVNSSQAHQISVSDSVSVAEDLVLNNIAFINVSESVTTAESVAVFQENLAVNKSDSTTVTATATVQIPTYLISVSENVTATESVTVRADENINLSDSVSVNEAATVLVPTYLINVTDSVTCTTTATLGIDEYINATDTASVSETATVLVPIYSIDVGETSSVSENFNFQSNFDTEVNDTAILSENIVVATGPMGINASESSDVSESYELDALSFVGVNDSSAASESVGRQVLSFVDVSDIVTASEAVDLSILLLVYVQDSISAIESIVTQFVLSILVSDSITAIEALTIIKVLSDMGLLGFFEFFE